MKSVPLLTLLTIGLSLAFSAFAQEDKPAAEKSDAPKEEAKKPTLTQEELEAKFIATLTKATMSGRWCLIHKGKLTPEKEDKYTISRVTKGKDGVWFMMTRIQYGNFDATLPVPVKVEWAGDAPVIIVDGISMPGGGNTYSARVIVYEDSYAGTWSGGKVKGLLSGMITRESE